jgi:hypothetical protein
MFRGGPVDSRGTGITSGLMDDMGYADGGRVGFQVGGGLFSSGPYNPYGSYDPSLSAFSMDNKRPLSSFAGPGPQNITGRQRVGLPPVQTIPSYYTGTARQKIKQREEDLRTQAQAEQEDATSAAFAKAFVPTGTGTGTGTGKGKGKGDIDLLSDEEDITRQAKLYEKLLGGEEARAQAGYDALLAAAPAFFKGKNLKEAAPQVLESINKSGAFDKPRDIKQAAAQLAIQRRLLMDKAGAEEKQRLAILSMKNQKDVFDVLKDQQIPIGSYLGSYETANREGGPGVLLNKYYLTNNNVLVRIDKGKDGQLIPTALGKI